MAEMKAVLTVLKKVALKAEWLAATMVAKRAENSAASMVGLISGIHIVPLEERRSKSCKKRREAEANQQRLTAWLR